MFNKTTPDHGTHGDLPRTIQCRLFLYDISSVVFSLDSFACIKVRSDEDKEASPVGKKPKQDHKAGEDRPLLVSKKGRDEDEEMSLDGGTFGRQNFTRQRKPRRRKECLRKKSRSLAQRPLTTHLHPRILLDFPQ